MQRLYFIRHGEKEASSGNPPLTARGIRQARMTAQYLSQFPITHVVASPLLRTQQTAAQIANALDLTHATHEFLRERTNWGDVAGQSFAAFLAEWKKSARHRLFVPQHGDSSYRAGQRIEQLIAELQHTEHSHIALVTHGGIISDFLRNIFPYENEVSIPECSITIVQNENGAFSLLELAFTKHLTSDEAKFA